MAEPRQGRGAGQPGSRSRAGPRARGGEGRGDSRFADITAGAVGTGTSSPAATAAAHPETATPRHRTSGKWRLTAGWLPGDPSPGLSQDPQRLHPDSESHRTTLHSPCVPPHPSGAGALLRTARGGVSGTPRPFQPWGLVASGKRVKASQFVIRRCGCV